MSRDTEKKPIKTNALRILESAGVEFEVLTYEVPEGVVFSGEVVSGLLGLDADMTFKTLTARGKSGGIYIFSIPVSGELSLKKAAEAVGEKSMELVHVKELPMLTGYERGAVSPLGIKKQYPYFLDETAMLFDKISLSGGAKGLSILISPDDLLKLCGGRYAELS